MMIDPLQLGGLFDGLRLSPSLVFGMTVSVSDGVSLVMLRGRHVVIETALLRHDECWMGDETRSDIEGADLRIDCDFCVNSSGYCPELYAFSTSTPGLNHHIG